MGEIIRRTALHEAHGQQESLSWKGAGAHVEALPMLGHVLIQLPAGKAHDVVLSLPDLAFPEVPNHAAGSDPVLMWLGPRAWVAITRSADDAPALAARIATLLRAHGGHAVDLSDAHQSLRISGAASSSLLAQGCALDLDGASFGEGAATRTSLAKIHVILHRTAADTFLLHVDRSLADQLWDWLGRGVREMAALAAIARAPAS